MSFRTLACGLFACLLNVSPVSAGSINVPDRIDAEKGDIVIRSRGTYNWFSLPEVGLWREGTSNDDDFINPTDDCDFGIGIDAAIDYMICPSSLIEFGGRYVSADNSHRMNEVEVVKPLTDDDEISTSGTADINAQAEYCIWGLDLFWVYLCDDLDGVNLRFHFGPTYTRIVSERDFFASSNFLRTKDKVRTDMYGGSVGVEGEIPLTDCFCLVLHGRADLLYADSDLKVTDFNFAVNNSDRIVKDDRSNFVAILEGGGGFCFHWGNMRVGLEGFANHITDVSVPRYRFAEAFRLTGDCLTRYGLTLNSDIIF